jgi:hypothetical protein
MAVIKLTHAKYVANSLDIKPKDAPFGASLYEYDTEEIYDKAVGYNLNNGWKLREGQTSTPLAGTMVNIDSVGDKTGITLYGISAGINNGDYFIGWRSSVPNPQSNADFDIIGWSK